MRLNKSSRPAATLALCLMSILFTGCGSADPETPSPENSVVRGPQILDEWRFESEAEGTRKESTRLEIVVPTCHGDPEATVEQTQASVIITVVSTLYDPGDSCQDLVNITLDEPLGDRIVVDGTTGEAVPTTSLALIGPGAL